MPVGIDGTIAGIGTQLAPEVIKNIKGDAVEWAINMILEEIFTYGVIEAHAPTRELNNIDCLIGYWVPYETDSRGDAFLYLQEDPITGERGYSFYLLHDEFPITMKTIPYSGNQADMVGFSEIRSNNIYIYAGKGLGFGFYRENEDYAFFNYSPLTFSTNSIPKYGVRYLGGGNGSIVAGCNGYGNNASNPDSGYRITNTRPSGIPTDQYIYLPIDPTETYTPEAIYDIIEDVAESYPDLIDMDNIMSYDEIVPPDETEETEETGNTGGSCGGCNVTVDAEGNVYIDGVQVDLTLIAQAGAFGAGAFGAGAIGQVDINGDIDISGGISGDLNLNGGDVTIDQSGSTITNNYYYYNSSDPVEPSEEIPQFTIDYDEILSEGELESILAQGDYNIETFPSEDYEGLYLPEKPSEPFLPVALEATPDLVNMFAGILSDFGMTPLYFPMGVFSIICYCLRGHR